MLTLCEWLPRRWVGWRVPAVPRCYRDASTAGAQEAARPSLSITRTISLAHAIGVSLHWSGLLNRVFSGSAASNCKDTLKGSSKQERRLVAVVPMGGRDGL